MADTEDIPRGPILLVGGGKMGGALLAGWLKHGFSPSDILAVEPDQAAAASLRSRHKIAVFDALPDRLERVPNLVLFAVKPQMLAAVVPPYKRLVGPDTAFLSIAAGKTIGFFERLLGPDAAVIRAMPNTPAAVGRGITVLYANGAASEEQMGFSETLMSAVGEVRWAADEAQFDAVTALSGSGPAYVFLLIESLAEAGVAAGLPADLAMDLARATVAGAGELAHQSPEPAETLRRNVTSPGGTTAAALETLMGPDGLKRLMTRAVAAAARRSKELAD
jgi:pyrroline-5-carboxylate reductase